MNIKLGRACEIKRFAYDPPMSFCLANRKRKKIYNICIKGLRNDHIYKIIQKNNSFYEHELLSEIYGWLGGQANLALDVGANIGNHTIYFAVVLGASVISFEPSSVACFLLKENIRLNNVLDKVRVVQAAIGNHLGTVFLSQPLLTNLGKSHVIDSNESGQAEKVELLTLDEAMQNQAINQGQEISLIKIDVEGFEKEVLSGAWEVISSYHPVIITETHCRETFQSINSYLRKHGYGKPVRLSAYSPTYLYDVGYRRIHRAFCHYATKLSRSSLRRFRS